MVKNYIAVLSIAGSDSGGGAGIQADLKTFAALGCYGMTVITATTAQNTQGVRDIFPIPASHIEAQLMAVLEDIPPKAIKIGMVNQPEVVEILAKTLKKYPHIPIVFDPVMVATSGDRLIAEGTVALIKELLFPLATLITPNLDEAAVLTGYKVDSVEKMHQAGKDILSMQCNAVLIKGGHLHTPRIQDILYQQQKSEQVYTSTYIQTNNLHGTGCTLSSAIAAELAKDNSLQNAVEKARVYIQGALEAGKDVKTGQGNGPLNHFYNPEKQIIHEME
ncbi:bifunctional hydroxymethylpyrimidine kinase/phosphomethylpyrimidine kinase [Mongoliitalea daihaiensis]|uniref:bifunctional hydroxymethylpyrimidine kinase/phosphomethylpyrimidine kinase n=1 Tax=Mongoliitalea daihaiensis TaxID=2782006 RepID=UPI001F32E585|nr:bifunctional hydroxymethylpyrimidine kinase/phosphomethylpyrimidine kinase [Mongoliitalea daihaiensis]UJP66192.1 bifunctional hydroxymethylpyrimidine kinase/phosphomethylpyrimidine kinase [Mongoliitalea daihaiensis]